MCVYMYVCILTSQHWHRYFFTTLKHRLPQHFRSMDNVDADDALEWQRNIDANVERLPRGSPHWLSLHWTWAPKGIKDRLLDVYDHDRFRHPDWLAICGNCEASLLNESNVILSSAHQCTLSETVAYCSTKCKQANLVEHGPHCKRVTYSSLFSISLT